MTKDLFSVESKSYAEYRPHYPSSLFDFILRLVPARSPKASWDVGTGNGQAAIVLAETFDTVYASDPSAKQLSNATPHPRVKYLCQPAEATDIPAHSIQLITVAQALHWFDRERFFSEVKRVSVKDGSAVLAVWCYANSYVNPVLDPIQQHYYTQTVGPYWEPERDLVEAGYVTLEFPFRELPAPSLLLEQEYTLEQYLGYLWTWSATQTCLKKTGKDPMGEIRTRFTEAWGDPLTKRRVTWKLFLRAFRID